MRAMVSSSRDAGGENFSGSRRIIRVRRRITARSWVGAVSSVVGHRRGVADQVISPELLPLGPGGTEVQSTEASVGPYELQDFYLYHFLRFGFSPGKLLFLAAQARFDQAYCEADRKKWLKVFLKRFFANQFKRSCMPDGPKIGSVSLSPRGDWRMPSDASVEAWLGELQ